MNDLWSYLVEAKRPLVMYGMGNGADKIIDVLDLYGLEISDFFASDGFVRGQSFHSKRVLSFSEIKEKYEDPIILVSFGSPRREVLDTLYEMSGRYEMYSPDVPLAGETLFNFEFFERSREKHDRVRVLLADETSRNIFDNVIKYKLSGRIDLLRAAVSDPDDTPLRYADFKIAVDAGAYTGDTASALLNMCRSVEKIFCLEPDIRNFRKLRTFADNYPGKINAIPAGAWDKDEQVAFGSAGNRNSNAFSGGKEILADMVRIDSVAREYKVDYIKYDVEGAEMKALVGSSVIIKRDLPDLLISLYHRSEDIFDIPLYINENYPEYKLYLRRKECVPAWEMDLIAVADR